MNHLPIVLDLLPQYTFYGQLNTLGIFQNYLALFQI